VSGYLTSAQRYDIVSVGDVAMDVFVHLPRGVERDDESGRVLALPLGSKILCDQDTVTAAGGDAANAAVAFARLGLRVAIAAFFAHDQYGRDLITAFHTEHVDTRLVHVDAPSETNRNLVLWCGGNATIIVRHQRFNWHWPPLRPSDVPAWVYLTSVGPNSLEYEDQIAEWLDASPLVRLAFRPGTAQLAEGASKLRRLFGRSEVVILTERDAATLVDWRQERDVDLLDQLLELGSRRVVVTQGDGGAIAIDDERRYVIPRYPDNSPPYERTGADDAFAATVVAGLVAGSSFEAALLRAPVNAMSVAHEIGAQAGLLTEEQLVAYLREVQPGFKVTTQDRK
jgi:sugar/nucleoside kinase (ribokinase family)